MNQAARKRMNVVHAHDENAIVLHVLANGEVVLGPVYAERAIMPDDWRSIAIDYLIQGKVQRAFSLMVGERDCSPMPDVDETLEVVSLPLVEVETERDARLVRAAFCRLLRFGEGETIQCRDRATLEAVQRIRGNDGHRYVLNSFDGSVKSVLAASRQMQDLYAKMKSRRHKMKTKDSR